MPSETNPVDRMPVDRMPVDRMKEVLSRFMGGEASTRESVASQLPGRENGPADAYRHILWAAEMTRRFGPRKARAVLEAKEIEDRHNASRHARSSAAASDMDDNNNEVGIAIGASAKTWDEVIARAQRVIDQSPRDGSGTGETARWLDKSQWSKNPVDAMGKPAPLNWPDTDWKNGQVPEPYTYDYDDQGGGPRRGARPPGFDGPATKPDHASRGDSGIPTGPVLAELPAAAAMKTGRPEEAERFEDAPEAVAEFASLADRGPGDATLGSTLSKTHSPEIAALVKAMTEDAGDSVDDILAKDPLAVTEGEVRRVMGARQRLGAGDPAAERMFAFENAFFDKAFGDQPAAFDETGRMIEPEPVRPVPTLSAPLLTRDGEPMVKGLGRVAERLADTADMAGLPNAVRALQAGLNILGDIAREQPGAMAPRVRTAGPDVPATPPGRIKEDGLFGDKTRMALKTGLAGFGIGRVDDALALGRFRNFIDDVRQGRAHGDLKAVTEGSFGPLFNDPDAPPSMTRHEAVALQEAVNDLGAGKPGFAPLKLDGDIGPKTAEAFARIARAAPPEDVTRRFADRLGLTA